MIAPQFQPVGDSGVMIRFGDEITDEIHAGVLAMDQAITAAELPGVRELVPSFTGLLVVYDPLETEYQTLIRAISGLSARSGDAREAREWCLPTCYEGDFAPDLQAVCDQTGLSSDAVINAHTSASYKLFMYGFAPGYGYLGGTPESIQLPRKTAPVRDIPKGAVMIAGPQCIVTTMVMPTGWWVIGRTDFEVFQPFEDNPFPVAVGDTIRFQRVSADDFMKGQKS
ncbi:5-oxoprolinase subunit PxpB [Halocynthiibacter styelae]|uniref:5-oxoprolinase subunit PxpB n=1 Tax=Halocynthiibacter styelae TaxID=2761955 RepID=A0A8J7J5K7_9RHOB|nr:5-oxoprolinase subunit PxpB [Paenihalocynthiibacter styelae]MBI1493860.1 5-oxoprolinase subunit PxpB [Paenihalocynthiibacter styelae]